MTDSRPPLQLALDAIPGYREAEAAIARLKAHRATTGPAEQESAIVDTVAAAARAGTEMPADIGRRVADSTRAQEFAEAETRVITAARRILEGERDDAARRGADDGLVALRGPLADVLRQVQGLASHLAGIGTAHAAIAAGPEAASSWARLTQLADQHAAIRVAQTRVVSLAHPSDSYINLAKYRPGGGSVAVRDVLQITAWASNLDEHWPQWPAAVRGAATRATVTAWEAPTPPPWPHNPADPLNVNYADPAFLLWLATSNARPWIPTIPGAAVCYLDAREAAARRQTEADEIRQYGHVRTAEERKRADQERAAQARSAARAANYPHVTLT
jgi:hypothetical protein